MWFSFIILFLAIAGLAALFLLKAIELYGKETPLALLREYGDPLAARSITAFGREARARNIAFCRRGYQFCRERALFAGSSALAFVHGLTLRLGEHLRKRKAFSPRDAQANGNVSFYLKNVLEYKKTQRVQGHTEKPATGNSAENAEKNAPVRNNVEPPTA